MKYFIYNFTFIPHGLIRTHKWPAPNVSGFIAQLVRASHRYREVTGSNPLEALKFSGFYRCTQLHNWVAFITARIITYLISHPQFNIWNFSYIKRVWFIGVRWCIKTIWSMSRPTMRSPEEFADFWKRWCSCIKLQWRMKKTLQKILNWTHL